MKYEQGNYRESLDYLQRSYRYSDSLNLVLTNQKIIALDHYLSQKESEIQNLKLTNENLSQKAEISNQRLFILAILLVLLIAFIAIFFLFRTINRLNHAKQKIAEQNRNLTDLNTTKSKLLAILTHDIRNPINNINGMLELARDGHITSEDFTMYAGALADQTDRLKMMSETLIKWSKSQNEGIKISKRESNISQLVSESFSYVNYLSEKKGIALNSNISASKVFADKEMLLIVLNNLLTNAIKFTNRGGTVSLISEEIYEGVKIVVRDTGVGVDEKIIENIMTGHVHTSLGTDKEKGSGIGLMLAVDFVTLHGGSIQAYQNADVGSSFELELPNS